MFRLNSLTAWINYGSIVLFFFNYHECFTPSTFQTDYRIIRTIWFIINIVREINLKTLESLLLSLRTEPDAPALIFQLQCTKSCQL